MTDSDEAARKLDPDQQHAALSLAFSLSTEVIEALALSWQAAHPGGWPAMRELLDRHLDAGVQAFTGINPEIGGLPPHAERAQRLVTESLDEITRTIVPR